MRFANLFPVGACIVMALVTCHSAHAQVVVTPDTAAATEGNTNNRFPFDYAFSPSSQRYQQVYASSLFSAITSPELITRIAFRPDAQTGSAFSSTLPDIQINLSTTSSADDALSTTFADNVGGNDTIVVPRGTLSLSSAFTGPAGGPKDFDIIIALATPFLYDPASGNLLLDVRNFGGGSTTVLDAVNTNGDGVSRAYTTIGNNVTNASGVSNTLGLVTQFTFQPAAVPEPGSLAFLATSVLTGAGFLARRRKEVNKAA